MSSLRYGREIGKVKATLNRGTTKDGDENSQVTRKRIRPREKYVKYNSKIEMEERRF
jgi:hypothetical protein